MSLHMICIEPNGVLRVVAGEQMTTGKLETAAGNPLSTLVGENWASNHVVLSLDRISQLDSSAVGWLLTCHKQFTSHGGRLVLHSFPPGIQQILDLMRIGSIIPLADDESAALALVRGDS